MAQQQWHDFPSGTRVQVRNRFDHRWASGFEIASIAEEQPEAEYRLRRLSDNVLLPVPFLEEEVRAE
jgi:hypothetical protein